MKKSVVLVWLAAAICLVTGVLYLIWPIAPYHEGIIRMTAGELAENHPNINALMTTSINVIGVSMVGIGLLVAYVGTRIWREKAAWWVLLVFTVVFTIPLAVIVGRVGGPTLLVVIPAVLQALGLGLAATVDKSWGAG